jgi:hypothetical protein
MGRKKRGSLELEKADKRLAGMKSIDKTLVLTEDINVTKYEENINSLRDKINDYNTALSVLDEQLAIIQDLEQALGEYSDRVLSGVAAKFGRDSDEYLKVGGKKKSDRKRPTRKTPPTP